MSEQIIRVTPTLWAVALHEGEGHYPPDGTSKRKAYRREPAFRARYVDPHAEEHGWGEPECDFRSTSFGCWQIMGENLRSLGYEGPIDRFAVDLELQYRLTLKLWIRHERQLAARLGARAGLWRVIEAWNKGVAGALRLQRPDTHYHGKVRAWLDACPAPGPDGLVPLRTVERKG